MSERERFFILAVGAMLALGITSVIGYLALTVTDTGERSILFGALIGTGAFGGGALFGLLGTQRSSAGASTVTIPQAPPDPPITVETNPEAVR